MKRIRMTVLVTLGCLTATLAAAGGGADTVPAKVALTCESCHARRGDSVSPGVPRLNGQQAGYIMARLKSFLHPDSQDPHAAAIMRNVAAQLDDVTITDMANYYARQTATQPQAGRRLAIDGRRLFEKGDAAEFIPACQSCHGAGGEGHGAIPRLAGQHAAYLTNQLERLHLGLRTSEAMHPVTVNMTGDQIAALVAYLAND